MSCSATSPPPGNATATARREDQVLDVARSDSLGVNTVSELSLAVRGELADVSTGPNEWWPW